MPPTPEQAALLSRLRFTYPDEVKAAQHIVQALVAQQTDQEDLDAAYAAQGIGVGALPRANLLFGTLENIIRLEEAVGFQEQLLDVLAAREAACLDLPRTFVWSPLITQHGVTSVNAFYTSHAVVVVTSLDGATTYVAEEHYTVEPNHAAAPYPNQHLITPKMSADRSLVLLPLSVRVTAP